VNAGAPRVPGLVLQATAHGMRQTETPVQVSGVAMHATVDAVQMAVACALTAGSAAQIDDRHTQTVGTQVHATGARV
jgi:hypothetical protein